MRYLGAEMSLNCVSLTLWFLGSIGISAIAIAVAGALRRLRQRHELTELKAAEEKLRRRRLDMEARSTYWRRP